jgi:DNA (cytosine-5)-methyltransferase 1
VELSWSDFFCGAGGSSSGIELVPGCGVVMAVNHWRLAIDTHNHNLPHADHDQANVARTDPRRYPGTDCAWFSPECTFWTVARGEKCDYDTDQMYLKGLEPDEDPVAAEAKWRSRMLMRDVVRFSRHHRYRAVIVENVPDILRWSNFDRWVQEMHAEGYRHKVLTLNSAFAQSLGAPAPQLRDRVYVVFWQRRYRTPNWDKWLRPHGWCPACGEVVRAVYSPKPGPRRPMRYGARAQYVYRCPNRTCRSAVVRPYALPALSVIDLSDPGQRIGDRKKSIAQATRDRIAAGLLKFRRPGVRTSPVDQPLTTQHTTASKALACPPMLVPTGGTRRRGAASAEAPMATRTTRENDAVVTPPFLSVLRSGRPRNTGLDEPLATVVADGSGHALVVPLRNNGVARPAAGHPLVTIAAGGEHHALVMRNNTPRGDAAQMCTPVGDPLRTLTTAGHQSLVTWGDQVLYSYDTGLMRPLAEPLPTQTGVEGDALVTAAAEVDDCFLRMLTEEEIKDGTGFDPRVLGHEFTLLGNAKRDKVKMVGNAVTPPTARDLAACVFEAITGVDIDPAQLEAVS